MSTLRSYAKVIKIIFFGIRLVVPFGIQAIITAILLKLMPSQKLSTKLAMSISGFFLGSYISESLTEYLKREEADIVEIIEMMSDRIEKIYNKAINKEEAEWQTA